MRLRFLLATAALFCGFVASAEAVSLPVSSGLQVWLDAADTSTVGLCSLGSSHEWNDKSTNAYNALPAYEFCEYDTDAFALDNGATVGGIYLRGNVDDTYVFTDAAAGDVSTESMTIFVAGKFDPTRDEYILTKRGSTEAGYRITAYSDASAIRYQAGGVSIKRDVDFANPTVFSVVHDRTLDTIAMCADGAALTAFGGVEYGDVEYVDPVADLTDPEYLHLGSNRGIQQAIEGFMGEILIYNRALDTTEVDSVNDYLMEKWVTGTTTPQVPGDANEDGKVDGSDVTILAGNWQVGVGGAGGASWEMGDFNGDGAVDGSDVTILAGNWQYGVTAAAAAVPEPSTLAMLFAGAIGLAFNFCRKRRIQMKRLFGFLAVVAISGVCLSATASTLPVTADLQVWLDPSNPDGMDICDYGTVHQTNDLSPNGYYLDRGHYAADSFSLDNGSSVGGIPFVGDASRPLQFSDSDAGAVSTESLTIFVVGDIDPSLGGYLLTKRGSTEAGYRLTTYSDGTMMRYQAGGVLVKRDVDFDASTVFAVVHDRTFDSVAMYADGNPLTTIDGVAYGDVEYVAPVADLSDTERLCLGSNRNFGAAITGDLGEILIYNRALDSTEINSVNAYLMEKWVTGPSVPSMASEPVPEPSTIMLLLAGMFGLIVSKVNRVRKGR